MEGKKSSDFEEFKEEEEVLSRNIRGPVIQYEQSAKASYYYNKYNTPHFGQNQESHGSQKAHHEDPDVKAASAIPTDHIKSGRSSHNIIEKGQSSKIIFFNPKSSRNQKKALEMDHGLDRFHSSGEMVKASDANRELLKQLEEGKIKKIINVYDRSFSPNSKRTEKIQTICSDLLNKTYFHNGLVNPNSKVRLPEETPLKISMLKPKK